MPFRKKYWYWNIETRKPEFGRQSRTERLLGPYRSKQEAEQAPRIIRERNAQWVAQEQKEADERRLSKALEQGKGQQNTNAGQTHGSTAASTPHNSRSQQASQTRQGEPQSSSTRANKTASRHQVENQKDQKDAWPSWKEFLEQPSYEELDKERRTGSSAPPAFFGDTSAIGVVGDDENGTFEQRVARFNKAREQFERESRQEEEERKQREAASARQAQQALAANRAEAQALLDEQHRTLPQKVSHSLHVWNTEQPQDQAGQAKGRAKKGGSAPAHKRSAQ